MYVCIYAYINIYDDHMMYIYIYICICILLLILYYDYIVVNAAGTVSWALGTLGLRDEAAPHLIWLYMHISISISLSISLSLSLSPYIYIYT